MVNREKYHGLEYHLDKLINSSSSEITKKGLIKIGDFLKKQAPVVYSEIKNNKLYNRWLDVSVGYIYILKENNKPVGFVGYGAGRDIKSLVLSHVYILKEFRGKGLFIEHLNEVNKFRFNKSNFIFQIQQPNRFLINSLLKAKFLIPINKMGLCMGLLSFFNIRITNVAEDLQAGVITPFYDLNLFSAVGVYDDELIMDSLCDVDTFYFNAMNIREYYSNNKQYLEAVKESVKFVSKELGDLALKEVGDCSGLFDRDGVDLNLKKVILDGD